MQQIRISKPKARKQHFCNWCELPIIIGEQYESSVNESEGELYTWKNHVSCREIAEKLKMYNEYWDEGLSIESFQEGISDEYYNLMLDKTDFKWPTFSDQLSFVKCQHLNK